MSTEKVTNQKPKRQLSGAAALGAGPGRPKGIPNKATTEFRETVNQLLQRNSENVAEWLDQVATGSHGGMPDPGKALDLLAKLAEFAAPKLNRTEVTGKDGGPVQSEAKLNVSSLSTQALAEIMALKDATDKA